MATVVISSLRDAFSQVADPRCRRGVRHPFSGMLALVFLALLGGMSEFAVICRWARRNWSVLQEPLGFTRPEPPCDTTLERTLARFSLGEFQEAFSVWLRATLADSEGLVAAVDGKTLKQGYDADGDPIQMLNVFAQDVKVCLGQYPLLGDKSTEPTTLKSRLAELFARYPSLWLLTGDALYCQRNLAEILVNSQHDYLFQLKGNQPDMLEAAETCFAQADEQPPAAETREKGRAVEIRRVWIDMDTAEWVRERLDFAGCRILVRVDRILRWTSQPEARETRYFVTSIAPEKITPQRLLQYIRGHWQVENNLHFTRDRWWDEDRHWLTRPGLAERLATLLGAALSMLQLTTAFDAHMPLRAKAEELAANPRLALNLIGALD